MNFLELQEIENRAAEPQAAEISLLRQAQLLEYFAHEDKKRQAKTRPFAYFCEDVTRKDLLHDFEGLLGKDVFDKATDDALSCLESCLELRKLSNHGVSGWLQNALHFINHLVLFYIVEKKGEKPLVLDNLGKERARFVQLQNYQGNIGYAGQLLNQLYWYRNGLEHRTLIHEDGRQELLKPQRSKLRNEVVKKYPRALGHLLKGCAEGPH